MVNGIILPRAAGNLSGIGIHEFHEFSPVKMNKALGFAVFGQIEQCSHEVLRQRVSVVILHRDGKMTTM